MTTLTRIFLAITLFAFISACSGKPESQALREAVGSYNRFVNYYLSGQTVLGERAFLRSVDRFTRIDSPCNIARVYLAKYVLDEEFPDFSDLESVLSYGLIGTCSSEINIARLLLGEDVERSKLDSHYAAYAALVRNGDTDPMNAIVNDSTTPNFVRSRYSRLLAAYFITTNPQKAYEHIERAQKIDRFRGWTVNLLRDLRLDRAIKVSQGLSTELIDERIIVLEASIR